MRTRSPSDLLLRFAITADGRDWLSLNTTSPVVMSNRDCETGKSHSFLFSWNKIFLIKNTAKRQLLGTVIDSSSWCCKWLGAIITQLLLGRRLEEIVVFVLFFQLLLVG